MGLPRPSDSRPLGAEQQSRAGKLMFRIPFVDYEWQWGDFFQGAILCAVPLGIIPGMQAVMDIPFDVAAMMVMINNFMYLWHTHFGDPSVAGWITPGIPLYMAFMANYAFGPERVQALIALQLEVAIIFLVLGFTGGTKIFPHVPASIRASVVLGAGIASAVKIFNPGTGYIFHVPWALGISLVFSFFMLYATRSLAMKKAYPAWRWIAQFGIAPGFVIGYIVGLLVGEFPGPTLAYGFIPMPMGELFANWNLFGVGMPSIGIWMSAIPMAIVAYILAFGDILIVGSILNQQNQVTRMDQTAPDELVVFRATRNSIITGGRNLAEGIFMPYLGLCGPQWTGGQAIVSQRFASTSKKDFPTYWGGATCLFWGMSIFLGWSLVVTLMKPALLVGFGLTLGIQVWLCGYVAMSMVTNNLERGIAAFAGCIVGLIPGKPYGLAAAVGLWLLLELTGKGVTEKSMTT